ncbi:MAG: prepilin-type N-terminal cleavage/methylation domain-containing protein [Thermoguttaceae bacterium]|nr:prepilin-type N-terminal cleavage/methylation domain-containing protein [Thermoguttaceae bacterium]
MNIGRKRPAFTLIELMIVIVIIAILAGLTTVGTRIAIRKSKEATVTLALEQLSMAIEKYKSDIGEYPPDFTDEAAVTRHVRKRWPRCEYADTFMEKADSTGKFDWHVDMCGPVSALVFWLGGIPDLNGKPGGFFLSPTDPLGINPGTSTQREEPRFNFPDGTVVNGSHYAFPVLGKDGEHFTTTNTTPGFQPGKGDGKPVVYFCASAPAENDLGSGDEIENGAYQMEVSSRIKYCIFFDKGEFGVAMPYAKKVETVGGADYWTWYEPDRFQLIHPGQDGLFSDPDRRPTNAYPYPCTAFGKTESSDNTLTDADDDNIVSFAEGGTLESLYPKQ